MPCASRNLWSVSLINCPFQQVIDPENNRPFYQYVTGKLEGQDVELMLRGDILRVIVLDIKK